MVGSGARRTPCIFSTYSWRLKCDDEHVKYTTTCGYGEQKEMCSHGRDFFRLVQHTRRRGSNIFFLDMSSFFYSLEKFLETSMVVRMAPLSFRRALNFFKHSTVSWRCTTLATRSLCCNKTKYLRSHQVVLLLDFMFRRCGVIANHSMLSLLMGTNVTCLYVLSHSQLLIILICHKNSIISLGEGARY